MKVNTEALFEEAEKAGLPTRQYPGGFRRGAGSGRKRILGPEGRANRYHVMSRTAGGEMLFGDVEKEAFCRIMRRLERFAGVEILTYAVMGNHFHLLFSDFTTNADRGISSSCPVPTPTYGSLRRTRFTGTATGGRRTLRGNGARRPASPWSRTTATSGYRRSVARTRTGGRRMRNKKVWSPESSSRVPT